MGTGKTRGAEKVSRLLYQGLKESALADSLRRCIRRRREGGRSIVRNARGSPLFQAEHIDEDQLALINGSPRVALDLENPFTRYIFIEPDPTRAAELEALQVEYGASRRIDIRAEDAASGIRWLTSQRISRRTHRGVAFLDPFGAGLEWSTIQALADTGFFEVVINFALNMAIQRMLPNSAVFQAGWRDRLDAYFGTAAWYDEVYENRSNLLGKEVVKRDGYLERLLSLYRSRLKEAFGLVSQPMLIRNTKGNPLYYLLWAGPNRKGLQGANYILSMGERPPRTAKRAANPSRRRP